MDALAKIFSSNKTKTNVSPDGGAPDTVGTTVAHTPVGNAQTPASEVPESTALDSGKHRDSAVHEMKSGVGAPPPESTDANPPDEGRTLEGYLEEALGVAEAARKEVCRCAMFS